MFYLFLVFIFISVEHQLALLFLAEHLVLLSQLAFIASLEEGHLKVLLYLEEAALQAGNFVLKLVIGL